MRLNISLLAPGNAWCTIRRVGYNAPVIHCLCWNAVRLHCAAGIPGGKTATAGEIPAWSYCRAYLRLPGAGASHGGNKGVPPPFNRMRTGKQLYPYLKGTRKSISAMAANILHWPSVVWRHWMSCCRCFFSTAGSGSCFLWLIWQNYCLKQGPEQDLHGNLCIHYLKIISTSLRIMATMFR